MRHGLGLGADARLARITIHARKTTVGTSDSVTLVVLTAPVTGEAAVAASEAVGKRGAGVASDPGSEKTKDDKENGEEARIWWKEVTSSSSSSSS